MLKEFKKSLNREFTIWVSVMEGFTVIVKLLTLDKNIKKYLKSQKQQHIQE